jgi:hypothetical protein
MNRAPRSRARGPLGKPVEQGQRRVRRPNEQVLLKQQHSTLTDRHRTTPASHRPCPRANMPAAGRRPDRSSLPSRT